MKLSRKIKTRMCGGCRSSHISRAELEEWVADAEAVEQENERLVEAIRPLFGPKRILSIDTDNLIEVEVDRDEWNNLLDVLSDTEGE